MMRSKMSCKGIIMLNLTIQEITNAREYKLAECVKNQLGGKSVDVNKEIPILSIIEEVGGYEKILEVCWLTKRVHNHPLWNDFARWCAIQNIEKMRAFCSEEELQLVIEEVNAQCGDEKLATDIAERAGSAAYNAKKAQELSRDNGCFGMCKAIDDWYVADRARSAALAAVNTIQAAKNKNAGKHISLISRLSASASEARPCALMDQELQLIDLLAKE